MLYNAFQSARYYQSVPSRERIYTPSCSIWTLPTQHSKLHLDRLSRFAQFTAESPYTFNVLTSDLKINRLTTYIAYALVADWLLCS